MAKVKMTFSLDRETVGRLRQAAERLAKPQSTVVSEAIHDFSDRVGRLSERERLRLLRVFDEVVSLVPPRPVSQVKKEIEEIRRTRRAGGRGGARDAAR